MGIKTIIMILASLSFSVSALAEDGGEKKPFSISGDFATSIQFYDNENQNGDHDEFNIDLAEIDLEKNWSKSKLHLSIGYGATANGINPSVTAGAATDSGGDTYVLGTPTNSLNLMNAYYSMDTSYGLNFMIGKFESTVGHETYNHRENSQYTRSYAYQLAPIFSTGAGLSYGQDMWSAGLIVSNGQGSETDRGDNNKTMGLIVDVDPMDNLHIDLNYVTGSESSVAAGGLYAVNILDVSAAFMINEMIDVALNYIDMGAKPTGGTEAKANSIALYGNANFGMFGLGLRYEMFSYDAGMIGYNNGAALGFGATGADNDISAITLTAKAEIDQNAMVLLEYRMDSSDDKIWMEKDGTTAADAVNTITAAVMYTF